jgi:hypothetical protein
MPEHEEEIDQFTIGQEYMVKKQETIRKFLLVYSFFFK